MNLKKWEIVLVVIGALLGAWLIVSYFDVIAHNLDGGTDAWWNFFVILFAE